MASWERRLQRVSLRTKIVVPIVVLAVVPALVIALVTILRVQASLEESAAQRIAHETASRALAVEEYLQAVQRDLLFLSQLDAVRNLATLEPAAGSAPAAVGRKEAEEALRIFSQSRRAYYQLRYLNTVGREVVRLNVVDGQPQPVALPQLQDKGQRYYLARALRLERGQIYVSPVDLNVERGRVETPQRAVVRYATPVSGPNGTGRGVLVINLDADHLLSLIGRLPSGTDAWLVDEEGFYVCHRGASDETDDRYHLDNRRQLSADYSPDDLAVLKQIGASRATIRSAEAILSHAFIAFDTSVPDRTWSLIVSQPRAPIDAPILRDTRLLSGGVALVLVAAGTLGVFLARYVARPVEVLRQATREIAAGDLSRRVEITTGDEIEELAVDFNAMTDRLREAQGRLSGWNEELEREVRRRTEQLRRLQRGLARADKLASIGQLTAGVMHEIGNPLAAIKTKIQVAEEEDDLDDAVGEMLSDILVEVDRLAAFLRSFSRLSRLRGPQLRDVSPAEVIHSVSDLVGPELERRRISLRVEWAAEVPVIRGDADQLRQLLINLILNAAEAYASPGEIVVEGRRGDASPAMGGSSTTAEIEITDRGTGIDAAVIDKIWDPFFTTKPDGTGLGLAICRAIVQDHGGTIHVQSEPGQGTAVSMVFPARPRKP